ncbi:Dps family protein [Sphaerisporangium aureirubrum]|uniref:DNA starvation/stationary phase protection protein n=1 Tax=Sphaerisporangium aureirubrum TaxID=1544736 RepID=A0ABW1NVN8_9ACTN
MAHITSPLSGDNLKVTGEALQGALTDLLDLALVGKQAHWNLVGRNFRSLHLQLDDIVSIARNNADEVAERAVALGLNPDGRAATVARETVIQQPELGYLEDAKMVAMFTDVLGAMVKRMRERVTATEEADPVSQDLLISATQELEKQHWMIQAQS